VVLELERRLFENEFDRRNENSHKLELK